MLFKKKKTAGIPAPVFDTDRAIAQIKQSCCLFAEDNPFLRESGKRMLLSLLREVDTAPDGQMAVDIFLQEPEKYSFIFMDIKMPLMDGITAAGHIRSQKGDTIIIAVTGEASGAPPGLFDSILSKPYDAGAMLGAIIEAMRNNKNVGFD